MYRIPRRRFLSGLGATTAAAAATAATACAPGPASTTSTTSTTTAPTGQAPNLLFLLTDQERSWSWILDEYSELSGRLGFARGKTGTSAFPARQWLLNNGLSFSRHHVTVAPCAPSRSVILTGRHVPGTTIDRQWFGTGVYDNTNVISNSTFPADQAQGDRPEWTKYTSGRRMRTPGDGAYALPTLGTRLAPSHHCAYKGKWHLTDEPTLAEEMQHSLEPYGFADWGGADAEGHEGGEGLAFDDPCASDAVSWLSTGAPSGPWHLTVSLVNPHDIDAFPKFAYPDTQFPAENEAYGEFLSAHSGCVASVEEMQARLPTVGVDDLVGKPHAHRWWKIIQNAQMGSIDSAEGYRQLLNNYLFMMSQVDASLDKVIKQAMATSLAQGRELYIVFTADHGESLGEHSLTSKGPEVYRGSKNVPLVVVHVLADGSVDPALAGRETSALTSSVDLVPTFLDLAGQPPAPDLKGLSLRPVLDEPDASGPRAGRGVLFTYDQSAIQPDLWPDYRHLSPVGLKVYHRGFLAEIDHGGRTRTVKYASYFNPGHQNDPPELHDNELYLLDEDHLERVNLACVAEHAELAGTCHRHLLDLIAEEGARVFDGDPTGSNNTLAMSPATG